MFFSKKKSPEEFKEPVRSEEEARKIQKEYEHAYRSIKKSLKKRSRSELIRIVIEYADNLQQHMELNKFLHEENKQLKKEKK